jgi:5-methylcytosine-specific restriction endonuclease McrA
VKIPAVIAEKVRSRARGLCEYCRFAEIDSTFRFHIEHVTPCKHGGSDDFENLALACPECNWRKGTDLTGLDPDNGKVTHLFNPRTQTWQDHFSLKFGRVSAKSPEGRTTLWIFGMNEEERVRCRLLYFDNS